LVRQSESFAACDAHAARAIGRLGDKDSLLEGTSI
jgi:hypothetical protein